MMSDCDTDDYIFHLLYKIAAFIDGFTGLITALFFNAYLWEYMFDVAENYIFKLVFHIL